MTKELELLGKDEEWDEDEEGLFDDEEDEEDWDEDDEDEDWDEDEDEDEEKIINRNYH